MVDFNKLERRAVLYSRYLTALAVVGSLGGSILMFFFGLLNIIDAFRYGTRVFDSIEREGAIPNEAISVISVIEGLDRFLIAIVLLYFSYGVYSLFIRPEQNEKELSLPEWLRVKQIGQLKQVVAEVIIVILFVLFLRLALRAFLDPQISGLTWQEAMSFLLIPVATTLLALSLRLVELHPKQRRIVSADAARELVAVEDDVITERRGRPRSR
jgi:uncharacterized membrane protein YqhA